jgi:tetratricopeptide (TPR) repeat protein
MLRAVSAPLKLLPALLLLAARAVAAPLPDAILDLHDVYERRPAAEAQTRLDAAATDPAAAPLARGYARWLRSRLALKRGDADAAVADVAALGFATRWDVVGPLAFPGVDDLDTALPPEQDWAAGTPAPASYPGREHPVAWHPAGDAGRFGLLDAGALSHNPAPGVLYLRGAFTLDAPARVALRVGASTRYRLWIDGRRVAAGGGRRPARFDQDAWLADLGPGDHRVLVKLGAAEEPAVFGLRLTTPEGEPLRFRERPSFDAPPATPPVGTAPSALADPLAMAEAQARAQPRSADAAVRYARLLALYAPDDEADGRPVEVWSKALALAPKRVDVFLGFARAVAHDRDRSRTLLEQAVALDPRDPDALAALARHQAGRGLDREARELWARVAARRPDDADAALAALEPLERLGLGSAVRARLATLRAAHPDDPEVAKRAADAFVAADRLPEAEAALRRALAVHAIDPDLQDRLLALLNRRGDVDALLGAYAARRRVEPFAADERIAEARALFGADAGDGGRRQAALALLEAGAVMAPERPDLWEALGDLRDRAGRTPEAVAAWERALALEPQRDSVRRDLAFVDPARRELADRVRRDARAAVLAAAPARGVGAWYLFDTTAIDVHPNGLTRHFRQYAIRLEDAAQAEALRYQAVSLVPAWQSLRLLNAEVIHPDGTTAEARRRWTEQPYGKVGGVYSDYEVQVMAFDDLRPGDTIHVAYVLEDVTPRNVLGEFFGHLEIASDRYPKADWSLWVRMPDDRPLGFSVAGLPAPEKDRIDGRPVLRWHATDLAAQVPEPDAPPEVERGPVVSVSTFRTWDDVARWYAGLIAGQGDVDDPMRDLAHELARAALGEDRKPGDDPKAVAKVAEALFDHVVSHTRYVGIELGVHGFQPYPAAQVLRRGYGDCKDKANLLATLLRTLGVDADIVLVRTHDQGHPPTDPPSPWVFNHAIVYVPILDRYFDATTDFGGPTELPTGDQGAVALRVDRSGHGKLVELPVAPADDNAWDITATLRLVGGGDALLVEQEQAGGAGAAMMRGLLQDPLVARRRLEEMLGGMFPGASVLDLGDTETRRDRPAHLSVTVRLPGFARGASVPVTPFPLRMVERYAQAATRLNDLVVAFPWVHRAAITVEAPEGAALEPPRDVDLAAPFGRYRRTVRRAADGWHVERDAALTVRRVSAADYPAFRAFCEAVDAAEADQGHLVPAGGGTR